ncbi:MAG: diguanylate cyclase [Coprothermobacterota bacterium]|nr:diguanylate cyclase [Coprothermobacterota bacterium]
MSPSPKLCLVFCRNLAPEVKAVLADGAFPDVEMATFPARCTGRMRKEALELFFKELSTRYDRLEIFGGPCLTIQEQTCRQIGNCALHIFQPCCHPLLEQNHLEEFLREGAYLLTPGWILHWREYLEEWGFDQATARSFFGEFCRTLLLLDTNVWPQAAEQLQQLGEYLDLPTKRVSLGLDFFRLFISRIVLEWRMEKENRSSKDSLSQDPSGDPGRQSAEYGMALDLLGRLTKTVDEESVIEGILELFTLLFAPARLTYLPIQEGKAGTAISRPPVEESEFPTLMAFHRSGEEYAWNEERDGFHLRMGEAGTIGVLEAARFAFPQMGDRYLNLALLVARVSSLAIANARAFRRLEEAKESLSRTTAQLEGIFQAMPDLFFLLEADGTIRDWKAGSQTELGKPEAFLPAESLLGNKLQHLLPLQFRAACLNSLQQASTREEVTAFEFSLLQAQDERSFEARMAPMAGGLVICCIVRDITERKRMEEKILTLSITDELTGLLNRRGFLTMATQQLKIAKRTKNRLWLIFADLDELKWINDHLGHEAGDRAIQQISILLKETYREADIFARIGGDEFVVLATEISPASAANLVSRFAGSVRQWNKQSEEPFTLDLSLGVSLFNPAFPVSLDELMRQADDGMYQQKRLKKAVKERLEKTEG